MAFRSDTSTNLIVRNAQFSGETKLRDVFMSGGRYVASEEHFTMVAIEELDAAGKSCIPSFVDLHVHLDKVFTADPAKSNRSGELEEAIEISRGRKRKFARENVIELAGRSILSAASKGITHLRIYVNVDPACGLLPLKAIVEARSYYSNLVDLKIVAFHQERLLQSEETVDLMWEAMELGADVVGGMPLNEPGSEESARHIEIAFDIAREFDGDVDMHIDETDDSSARTLEMLARDTIANGWQGRVTAGHTCALAAYTDDYVDRGMALVKEAAIHIVTNPATNLMPQGRENKHPKRRGITRVKELMAQGVNVSFGQDHLQDVFYPFGLNNPLEIAFLTGHAAHMSAPEQINQIFDMPTAQWCTYFAPPEVRY